MSPRTAISLALLALALLSGFFVARPLLEQSDRRGTPTSGSASAIISPESATGAREPLSAITALTPSGNWASELDDVDLFNDNLECDPRILERGFTADELPRFKALLAEFRDRIIDYENGVVEVVESEEGVSLRIVANDESTQIADWFADELGKFGSAEALSAKYLEADTYTDLTVGIRMISMRAGGKVEWRGEWRDEPPVVFNLLRGTKGNAGFSRLATPVDSGGSTWPVLKRYQHVIDIPATRDLLMAEAVEDGGE